jgi:hypothetical protein
VNQALAIMQMDTNNNLLISTTMRDMAEYPCADAFPDWVTKLV